jgi:hypothetical protein
MNQREQVAAGGYSYLLTLVHQVNDLMDLVDFLYPEDGGDMFLRNVG